MLRVRFPVFESSSSGYLPVQDVHLGVRQGVDGFLRVRVKVRVRV